MDIFLYLNKLINANVNPRVSFTIVILNFSALPLSGFILHPLTNVSTEV